MKSSIKGRVTSIEAPPLVALMPRLCLGTRPRGSAAPCNSTLDTRHSQLVTLYGIPNCNTIKAARAWLDGRGIAYDFHDYKKRGLDEATLRAWVSELGWKALINKRGQMWRKLDPALSDSLDEEAAIRVMLETPSIIRRPVLDTGQRRSVGFHEGQYAEMLSDE